MGAAPSTRFLSSSTKSSSEKGLSTPKKSWPVGSCHVWPRASSTSVLKRSVRWWRWRDSMWKQPPRAESLNLRWAPMRATHSAGVKRTSSLPGSSWLALHASAGESLRRRMRSGLRSMRACASARSSALMVVMSCQLSWALKENSGAQNPHSSQPSSWWSVRLLMPPTTWVR